MEGKELKAFSVVVDGGPAGADGPNKTSANRTPCELLLFIHRFFIRVFGRDVGQRVTFDVVPVLLVRSIICNMSDPLICLLVHELAMRLSNARRR
jgi:hypothetical protein